MKKGLTQEQHRYLRHIIWLVSKEVGGLDRVRLKDDEYSYIEFDNDRDFSLRTLKMERLQDILNSGEYTDEDADYMNKRKEMFKRMLNGEKFIFGIEWLGT